MVAAAEGGKLPLLVPRPAGGLASLLSGTAAGPDAADRSSTRTIWPANGADDSETAKEFLPRIAAEIDAKGSAKRTKSVEDGPGQ